MGAAIIATTTTSTSTTTTRTTTEEIAWQHRHLAAAISLEHADLTRTLNRIGEASNWTDARIARIEADLQTMEAQRAFHLIRAKLLTCGRSHE